MTTEEQKSRLATQLGEVKFAILDDDRLHCLIQGRTLKNITSDISIITSATGNYARVSNNVTVTEKENLSEGIVKFYENLSPEDRKQTIILMDFDLEDDQHDKEKATGNVPAGYYATRKIYEKFPNAMIVVTSNNKDPGLLQQVVKEFATQPLEVFAISSTNRKVNQGNLGTFMEACNNVARKALAKETVEENSAAMPAGGARAAGEGYAAGGAAAADVGQHTAAVQAARAAATQPGSICPCRVL